MQSIIIAKQPNGLAHGNEINILVVHTTVEMFLIVNDDNKENIEILTASVDNQK